MDILTASRVVKAVLRLPISPKGSGCRFGQILASVMAMLGEVAALFVESEWMGDWLKHQKFGAVGEMVVSKNGSSQLMVCSGRHELAR